MAENKESEDGSKNCKRSDTNAQLDSILEELGNFGKFQIFNYLLIVVPIFFNAMYTTSYIFTVRESPYRCLIHECDHPGGPFAPEWLSHAVPSPSGSVSRFGCTKFPSINNSRLSVVPLEYANDTCPRNLFIRGQEEPCEQWVYENHNTIVSEFDLACQDWKRTLVGTMNNIGQFFCLPLTGWISDRYGRRAILAGGIALSGVVGLLKSFSPEYWSFLFFEFLDPFLGSGVYSAAFILGVELVGPKHRVIASTFVSSSYAIGEILLGFIAWMFPYWRTLLRICYAPSLLFVCYFWLVPESVRWLLTKGKFQAAGKVLLKAASVNGIVLSEKSLQNLYSTAKHDSQGGKALDVKENKKSLLKLVFKSKIMMVRLICCSSWWITCTLVYYGLSLNAVSIAGNTYLNFILVCLIEIPGYVVYYFSVDRFGRRRCQCLSFLGCAIACFSFPFIPENIFWLKLSLYLFGKLCITVAFTVLYVYTTELFPTPLRHSLLAACSMLGRVGSIVAPQTPLLATYMESLPLLLFGTSSLISGFMVLGFPETNNTKLPDTIEEAENISRRQNKHSNAIHTAEIN